MESISLFALFFFVSDKNTEFTSTKLLIKKFIESSQNTSFSLLIVLQLFGPSFLVGHPLNMLAPPPVL